MIRHSKKISSESWKNLNWKKFRKDLFRLQCRVFKAIKAGNKRKALSLQKLILKSKAARFLAIRQVTQLNSGKKTAGIDGVKSLNFKERFELEELLKENSNNWKHQGLRSIPIPKKDGSTRNLKIPTIKDRAWQCLVKYAIEPAHEAQFHANSYGFRPGRSAHDAQHALFMNLSSIANGITKRILSIDIEKCFDRINHSAIMERVIAPKGIKEGIFRCLKAGTNPGYPDQGTPQGGVISPLLANIALNGIEEVHSYNTRYNKKGIPNGVHVTPTVRYADDMVVILRPEDNETRVFNRISRFLRERGLMASKKKTKLHASTEGFDYLGWHFKVLKDGRFKAYPSDENLKKFKKKVKSIVNCSNYGSKLKAKKLAPIVRGWRNYHKHCDMSASKHSLWFLHYRTWKVFNKEKRNSKESTTKLINIAFPKVSYSEHRFVKVRGNKSPYDNDINYWSKRNSKLYDNATAKALRKQNHTCGHCGLKFTDDEKVHLHHIDSNHNNWKTNNLMAVHESCHDYIHMSNRVIP